MAETNNKAVFLDRDGTINVDRNYLYRIEDFEFLPGVIDAMKEFLRLGYMIVIVTNQSGIARGYYSEEDFRTLNDWMISYLNENGVRISGVYYCPHLPDATVEKYRIDCNCRKPKTGLFHKAAEELGINLAESIVIGDRIRDLTLADEVPGCRGYLIGSERSLMDVAENL